jgi:TonB family protein
VAVAHFRLVRSMAGKLSFVSLSCACATSLLGQPSPAPIHDGKHLATYATAPQVPAEARAKHLAGSGVCVLYVRDDGTVSRVVMLKSTGQPLLDKASIDAFSRWRFIPGSIRKVKIPISYTGNYTKPPDT